MPRPGQHHTAEARAKISAAQNAPGVRAARRAGTIAYWTPERRREASEATKARMADPAIRAKISEKTTEAMARPEVQLRQRVNQKLAMARPDVREKISKATKAAMANPEARALARGVLEATRARPDHGQKISAGIKKSWAADHERKALNEAWSAARPEIRIAFLEGVGIPALFAAGVSRVGVSP